MTKREFMAMSLPYGIRTCLFEDGVLFGHASYSIEFNSGDYRNEFDTDLPYTYKPILRPLSDLAKEIEQDGRKFCAMDKSGANYDFPDLMKRIHQIGKFNTSNKEIVETYFNITEILKLVEWHFDIAGLIEQGEAIDINTLNEKIY